MKAVIVPCPGEIRQADLSFAQIRHLLGGKFRQIALTEGCAMLAAKGGHRRGLGPNWLAIRIAEGNDQFGTIFGEIVVVIGRIGDRFADMSDEAAKELVACYGTLASTPLSVDFMHQDQTR